MNHSNKNQQVALLGDWVAGAMLSCAIAITGCGNGGSNNSQTSAGGSNAGGAATSGGGGSSNSSSTAAGASNAGRTGTGGGSGSDDPSTAGGASTQDVAGNSGGSSSNSSTTAAGANTIGGATNTGGTSSTSSYAFGGASTVGGNGSSVGGTTAVVSSTKVPPSGIDLLFMIDNSSSMADKQGILAAAVPGLLTRLVQPNCLDTNGNVVGRSQVGVSPPCAQGKAEFKPINDIHLGIITSSLGDHGGDSLCAPGRFTSFVDSGGNPISELPDVNDQAHLIGTLARYSTTTTPTARATVDATGFLAWGDPSNPPMTDGDLTAAKAIFKDMVMATGEMGCGLEAQLESWFRFLIDPVPPIYPIQKDASQQAARAGSDDALLQQRAAFLRPNSLVAIVMLTDENDCSLRDTDVGWVATDTRNFLKSGSAICGSNPNDKCCYSCTANGPPSGCADGCAGAGSAQDDGSFQANIRCWHQKRRFGYEFMYPISRYVVGLTHQELCPDQTFGDMDCDCMFANSIGAKCVAGSRRMPNPLYSNVVGQNNAGIDVQSKTTGAPRADNWNVFLAGILGVPWQDIGFVDTNGNLNLIPVTDPAWTSAPASAAGPVTPAPNGIWQLIYGDDNANITPADVHMVESIEPRSGLPGPTAAATADAIVGREFNTAYEDLEYACIFPLSIAKPCQCDDTATDYSSCKYLHPNDCCDLTYNVDGRTGPGGNFNKPLCQSRTQVAAKAYPGLREIAVLHDYALGVNHAAGASTGNSIVASICPKDTTSDASSPGYGFNPALQVIINRIKNRLQSD